MTVQPVRGPLSMLTFDSTLASEVNRNNYIGVERFIDTFRVDVQENLNVDAIEIDTLLSIDYRLLVLILKNKFTIPQGSKFYTLERNNFVLDRIQNAWTLINERQREISKPCNKPIVFRFSSSAGISEEENDIGFQRLQSIHDTMIDVFSKMHNPSNDELLDGLLMMDDRCPNKFSAADLPSKTTLQTYQSILDNIIYPIGEYSSP